MARRQLQRRAAPGDCLQVGFSFCTSSCTHWCIQMQRHPLSCHAWAVYSLPCDFSAALPCADFWALDQPANRLAVVIPMASQSTVAVCWL